MQLLGQLPGQGSVTHKEYFEGYDAHLWTLSNGVKVALKQYRENRDFLLRVNISSTKEELKGHSSVQDLKHFLQYLHLAMTHPRKDSEVFKRRLQQEREKFKNLRNNRNAQFHLAIQKAKYGKDPR